MTTVETLRAARALIADPEHWCQGARAKDKHGLPVWTLDPTAVAWCAIGACRHAGGGDFNYGARAYLASAAWAAGERGIVELNDLRDHAAVMAMFDRAIERAEDEGKA